MDGCICIGQLIIHVEGQRERRALLAFPLWRWHECSIDILITRRAIQMPF